MIVPAEGRFLAPCLADSFIEEEFQKRFEFANPIR